MSLARQVRWRIAMRRERAYERRRINDWINGMQPPLEQRIIAVRILIEHCLKISPNAVIEARLVEQALDTGRVPVLEQRKAMF